MKASPAKSPTADVSWFKKHAHEFAGQLLFQEPLAKYTYYQIGGPASVFAAPKTREDLEFLREGMEKTQIPYFIMGQGSNLLVADEGYPGLIIRANRMNTEITELDSPLRLKVGASVAVSSLLRKACQEGWGGLEFLTGIPGSIGGVVKMNAGTHLGEAQSRIYRVEAFLLERNSQEQAGSSDLVFQKDQMKFQYRKSLFLPEGALIWRTEWEIEKSDPGRIKSIVDETLKRRKATQPVDYPSCGSVFKNPKSAGLHAWQVVDQLGLRGYQIGQAQFAEKHSNFIINLGGAKASDVLALIQLAQTRARDELGIQLEEEVIFLS